jgi:hypothetical protein
MTRMIVGLTALIAAGTASAVPGYVSSIPNGSVNSCCNCHQACSPPALNAFGNAFANNNHAWNAALATKDSDGDGFTNGQELGDPTGSGTPITGASVSLPGDATSKPTLTLPNISISSPANGANVSAPFTGPVTASSTADPRAIVAVQFFSGSTLLGTDTTAPYSQAVNLAAGGYNLTARAIDYLGASNTSPVVTITVASPALSPTILTQPASQTVFAGANVTFTVSAGGTPPLHYQWQKNSADIAGANSSSLTLTSVTSADAATYRVVVTNTVSSVTSSDATLVVNAAPTAPSITTQPVSQSVNAGANVSFTVAASGTAPLSYQWRKNSTPIAGATNPTLNLTAVTVGDNGTYSAVVTNAAGSATSANATLTVTQTTVIVSITSPTNGATFTAPATFTLAASATPTTSVSRVDFYQGATLLGSLSSGPFTFNVLNLGAGSYSYTARAVSSSGTTTSAPVNVTVSGPPAPAGPSTVTITATDPNASEVGLDPGTFQVTRTDPMTNALTVYYLIGGTAENGLDYQTITNQVTILENSATASIRITPILDSETPVELSDTVVLQLDAPPVGEPSYTIGTPSNAVVTIAEVVSNTNNLPPVVRIVAPRNGAVFRRGSNILLAATATASSGSIVSVEFFANTTDLGPGALITTGGGDDGGGDDGGGTRTVYVFNWTRVPSGRYAITAVATDSNGATTISAPVNITVRSRSSDGGDSSDYSSHDQRGGHH